MQNNFEGNQEEKVIQFPFSGEVEAKVGLSTMYVGDAVFGNLPPNVERLPEENLVARADFQNVWKSNFRKILAEASLPEIPENIKGLKNGTIIQMETAKPEKGAHAKEELVLFFDGRLIHAGGIDAPLSWTLEELILDINKGEVNVVGQIE